MDRSRVKILARSPRLSGVILGVGTLVFVAAASGASFRAAATGPTTITVTAGKPTELSLSLSRKSVPAGKVTFKVTNHGKVGHTFKVCSSPSKSAAANSCRGKVTKILAPGASATLTVTLKTGTYGYLWATAGHAGKGAKGSIGVTAVGSSVPKTTPTTTTTTGAATPAPAAPAGKPPATEALIGDPVDGATVFKIGGCGFCHWLSAAGASGSQGANLDSLAPDQQTIVEAVTDGSIRMPAFGGTLTAKQINDVAAYIYQSTHASS